MSPDHHSSICRVSSRSHTPARSAGRRHSFLWGTFSVKSGNVSLEPCIKRKLLSSRRGLSGSLLSRGGGVLQDAVVSPRPSRAEKEFLHTIHRRVRIVQCRGLENDAKFAQQFFERG